MPVVGGYFSLKADWNSPTKKLSRQNDLKRSKLLIFGKSKWKIIQRSIWLAQKMWVENDVIMMEKRVMWMETDWKCRRLCIWVVLTKKGWNGLECDLDNTGWGMVAHVLEIAQTLGSYFFQFVSTSCAPSVFFLCFHKNKLTRSLSLHTYFKKKGKL